MVGHREKIVFGGGEKMVGRGEKIIFGGGEKGLKLAMSDTPVFVYRRASKKKGGARDCGGKGCARFVV